MFRVHLSTGVIVKVADHEAAKLQSVDPSSHHLVECMGSVNDHAPQAIRINPKHIALLEKM